MNIDAFIATLSENPEAIEFNQTMAVIEENYHFTPTAFTNGKLHNEVDTNNGSCKIFAFGRLHQLSTAQTLACFGKFYFEEVLNDPNGEGHQNIRNFMEYGWEGITFEAEALQLK